MVVELSRVEVGVSYVLWCSRGSLHRAARFGDLHGNASTKLGSAQPNLYLSTLLTQPLQ